jgi:adenosylhomocysteine nucleosidase
MISYWKPKLIINLSTCRGIAGEVVVGDVILVERTIVYDIFEKMTDPNEAINAYSTDLDLSWLDSQYPLNLKRGLMHSADRDLSAEDIPLLKSKFGAKAVDWESGSIARICNKNNIPCLILRAVTDTVFAEVENAAYKKNHEDYRANTLQLIPKLVNSLPDWELMFHRNYLK